MQHFKLSWENLKPCQIPEFRRVFICGEPLTSNITHVEFCWVSAHSCAIPLKLKLPHESPEEEGEFREPVMIKITVLNTTLNTVLLDILVARKNSGSLLHFPHVLKELWKFSD